MPPKSKNKAIEDKTFGMKNKSKSKKVQQYVQHLQAQVRLYTNHVLTTRLINQAQKSGSKAEQDARTVKEEKAAQKRAEEERKREMAALFTQAVIQPKVPFGKKMNSSIFILFYLF